MKCHYTRLIEKIRDEKRLYSIWSVLGRAPTRSKMICPLPFHVHVSYTPSFAVHDTDNGERWRCFGSCNLEGDVVDLVGHMNVTGYDRGDVSMLERAWNILDGGRYKMLEEIPKPQKKATLSPDAWRNTLGTEVIEYAKTRGLTVATLEKFRIGQVVRSGQIFMSMPVFENGELVAVKYRSVKGKSFSAESGSRAAMLNFDAVNYTDEPVLILKGEIPVYLCDQLGFLSCSFTGGEGYSGELYYPNLVFSRRRVVVGDNDAPGIEGATRRAGALKAELRFPPENYKDIDAWILDDPGAVEVIRKWLED